MAGVLAKLVGDVIIEPILAEEAVLERPNEVSVDAGGTPIREEEEESWPLLGGSVLLLSETRDKAIDELLLELAILDGEFDADESEPLVIETAFDGID